MIKKHIANFIRNTQKVILHSGALIAAILYFFTNAQDLGLKLLFLWAIVVTNVLVIKKPRRM